MTDTVFKHNREFQFDDGTSDEAKNTRINNWMRQNAPDELEEKKVEEPPKEPTPGEIAGKKSGFNPTLANIATMLAMPIPGYGAISMIPGVRERLGDKNFYRTFGQGLLPFADEATAGVRSILPDGPDYSTALDEERQGPKDYGEKYGEAEKTGLELAGGLSAIPLTMGAGAGLQGLRAAGPLAKAGAWMLRNPWKSSIGVGAGTSGITGFGSGEGGFENRMENAAHEAPLGAVLGPTMHAGVKSADKILGWANTDNRVADLLRRRLSSERDALRGVDPNSEDLVNRAMPDLRRDIAERRSLSTEPMVADTLPNMTEQVMTKRGPAVEDLARKMLRRQYNDKLPEKLAGDVSQRGRVGDAFDLAFGPDLFKKTDADLIKQMKSNADVLYRPAYAHNIRSPEIDASLNKFNTLDPAMYSRMWDRSKRLMEAENKPIGTIDATGNLRSYNTEFLHNMKRQLDAELGIASRDSAFKFDERPYLNTKRELNEAMKTQNSDYRLANEQFGEDADLIKALKKGREEAFPTGSVDVTGGMKGADIKAHLADPNVTQAEKDLFRQGAARALRERTLASNSKKFTHNWADFINAPEMEERMGALLSDKLGSWDLLRSQLKKESGNYKTFSGAVGNSKTAARQEMQREMEGLDVGRIGAGVANPGAFGTAKAIIDAVKSRVDPGTKLANKAAEILGRQGTRGNRSALNEIESLLRAQDARRKLYGNMGAGLPAAGPYSYPYRSDRNDE